MFQFLDVDESLICVMFMENRVNIRELSCNNYIE